MATTTTATATPAAAKKEEKVETKKESVAVAAPAISRRDFFAGMAMTQLMVDRSIAEKTAKEPDALAARINMVKDIAYKYADAMIG